MGQWSRSDSPSGSDGSRCRAAAAGAAALDWAGGAPTCASAHISCYASDYNLPGEPVYNATDNATVGCLYAKQNGFLHGGPPNGHGPGGCRSASPRAFLNSSHLSWAFPSGNGLRPFNHGH